MLSMKKMKSQALFSSGYVTNIEFSPQLQLYFRVACVVDIDSLLCFYGAILRPVDGALWLFTWLFTMAQRTEKLTCKALGQYSIVYLALSSYML